jgi:hypothetical protein
VRGDGAASQASQCDTGRAARTGPTRGCRATAHVPGPTSAFVAGTFASAATANSRPAETRARGPRCSRTCRRARAAGAVPERVVVLEQPKASPIDRDVLLANVLLACSATWSTTMCLHGPREGGGANPASPRLPRGGAGAQRALHTWMRDAAPPPLVARTPRPAEPAPPNGRAVLSWPGARAVGGALRWGVLFRGPLRHRRSTVPRGEEEPARARR